MTKASLFAVKQQELCPLCQGELVFRSGKKGPYLRCTHYPTCTYLRTLTTHPASHIIKTLPGTCCPLCQSVLVLRQGRYGMFISCQSYPDCTHTEPLRNTETTQVPCPQCGSGELLQRQSRYGKAFYACSRYPACHFAINSKPVNGRCPWCQYPLLIEKKVGGKLSRWCAAKNCGKRMTGEADE